MATVKDRSTNWSSQERTALIDAMTERGSVLQKSFNKGIRKEDRDDFWVETTARVNAVGGQGRSTTQSYKKWQDLKRDTKRIETARVRITKKTGGGAAPPTLTVEQEKIVSTIPKCCTEGLEGGIDTGDANVTDSLPGNEAECLLERNRDEIAADVAIRAVVASAEASDKQKDTAVQDEIAGKNQTKKRGRCDSASANQSAAVLSIEKERLILEKENVALRKEELIVKRQKLAIQAKQLETLIGIKSVLKEIANKDSFEIDPSIQSLLASTSEL